MRLTVLAAAVVAAAALAQTSGTGVGLILGEPTGVCLKSWLSGNSALTVGAAWAFQHEGNLFLYADYTLHSFNITDDEDFRNLAFYYGLGGKLSFEENKGDEEDKTIFGARIPLGLMLPIGGAPVDLFVEGVPTIDLIPGTDFGFNGGIGGHIFF